MLREQKTCAPRGANHAAAWLLTGLLMLTAGCNAERSSRLLGGNDNNSVQNPVTDGGQNSTDNASTLQLVELSIFSTAYTVALGSTVQLYCVGTYSDSSTAVVTASVQWSVANPSLGAVANTGLFHALGVGSTQISASLAGVSSGSVPIAIVQPEVSLLLLAASPTQLQIGQDGSLTVMAQYSAGSLVPVTQSVTWNVSDSSILAISSGGTAGFQALAAGTCTVTATLSGVSSQPVTIEVLDSLDGQWIDTDEDSSMDVDNSLFTMHVLDGAAVFGTSAGMNDIHSHFVGPSTHNLSNYEFTGRMRYSGTGGMGVTFYSDYPNTDTYYRIRINPNNQEWRISPHPFGLFTVEGSHYSGVVAEANTWYAFRILVTNQSDLTRIQARVWPDSGPEPSGWPINATHAGPSRLLSGTIGCSSEGTGSRYWADLAINGEPILPPDPFALTLNIQSSNLQVGQTTSFTAQATYLDGSSESVTSEVDLAISNPGVVSQSGSTLAAVSVGVATVVATLDGVSSVPKIVTVGSAVPPPPPLPPGTSGPAATVTRHGITWHFNQPYTVGQYANGDYWVIGPVTINQITPVSVVSGSYNGIARVINGSMINPPVSNTNGYDSRLFAQFDNGSFYQQNLNRAWGVSAASPRVVQPGSSLVSTISYPTPGNRPGLLVASILTVVGSAPPAGSFRPPYVGTNKTSQFNVSQINYSHLRSLNPVAGTPPLSQSEAQFEKVWLDHGGNWMWGYGHPSSAMPNYGREMAEAIGTAALHLNMNYTNAQKQTLMIRFLQLGIDFYGITQNGGTTCWEPNGGHASGRKFPILFAGKILGHAGMLGIGSTNVMFGEDEQTFYVQYTSPGVINNGHGGYNSSHIGMAEWGIRHTTHPSSDSVLWSVPSGHPLASAVKYRRCCTANVWAAMALAAHAMGLKNAWNHNAFFDYVDRYLSVEPPGTYHRQWNNFHEVMWDTYRANYP